MGRDAFLLYTGRRGKQEVWRAILSLSDLLRQTLVEETTSGKWRSGWKCILLSSPCLHTYKGVCSPFWKPLGQTTALGGFVSDCSMPPLPPLLWKTGSQWLVLALNLWLLTSHESFRLPTVIRDSLVTFSCRAWWPLWKVLPPRVLNVIRGLKCVPFGEAFAGHLV